MKAMACPIVVVTLALAGCGGSGTAGAPQPLVVQGHPFVPAGPGLLQACRRTAATVHYAVPCPTLVPKGLVAGPQPPAGTSLCPVTVIGPQSAKQFACALQGCPRCEAWRGWVTGSSLVPGITARTGIGGGSTELDEEHLVVMAAPRVVPDAAKAVDGPGWYPGARIRPLGRVSIDGRRVQVVFVPPATNDGSAFAGHFVWIWTEDRHTYAVGFHDLLGKTTTLELDRALVGHIRLIGP